MEFFMLRKENLGTVIYTPLKKLNIKGNNSSVEACSTDHPDYPGFLVLSDCLASRKITNNSFRLIKSEYNFSEFEYPFVSHLNEQVGKFSLVNAIADEKVSYSDENNSVAILAEQEFLQRWDGIVLHNHRELNSSEANYRSQLIKASLNQLRLPFFLLMLLGCIAYAISNQPVIWPLFSILILELIGIGISALLLVEESALWKLRWYRLP